MCLGRNHQLYSENYGVRSMRLNQMTFMKYMSPTHPKTGATLDKDADYYAVPGGGITTESLARLWGIQYLVKCEFNRRPWGTK